MDFSKALAEGGDNTPIADHRADPEANRTENAYPPRGIFDRRAELLAQRLSLLLIVRGSALGFFHMFELCNKLIDVVTHAGTLLCRLGAYAEAAALTLVLKDLDKRSRCRGLGFVLLHQLPLRAHRVERLQQQRSQQPLRRDRRSAFARIKPIKRPRQLSQRRVDEFADRALRMIRRNTSLQTHVAEKAFRLLIFTAHRFPNQKESVICTESHPSRLAKRLFQQSASCAS